MKKMILILALALGSSVSVLWADKTGVGKERAQDRTGSPFATSSTQQCDKCHTGGNFNSAITMRLKDSNGNVVTEYNGGESYTYEVEVTGTGARFGFQSVALLSSNNANAGDLTVNSSNTRITTLGGTRKYGEHLNPSTTGLFILNWVAPAPGSGAVKFYASGNTVNNNNASSGDDPVTSLPLTINESAVSSVNGNETEIMVSLYPNPASDVLNIRLPEGKSSNITIVDINGKTIYEQQNCNEYTIIDFSNFEKGMYFIHFTGDVQAVKKIMH